MFRFLSCAVLLLMSLAPGTAQEVKAFVCRFNEGVSATYEGRWRQAGTSSVMEFTFAALDATKGTAQFIGNVGASQVAFSRGAHTWNFLEVTDTGNMMTTTIFESADGGSFPVVHSRHTALGNAPLPSQSRGVCAARN